MSLESAKKFVEKMQKDDNFAKSFFACSDPEARKSFIKEHGFDFTKEEVDEAREGIEVAGGTCCGRTCEQQDCTSFEFAWSCVCRNEQCMADSGGKRLFW